MYLLRICLYLANKVLLLLLLLLHNRGVYDTGIPMGAMEMGSRLNSWEWEW